jgi:hypothetical protein
MVQLLHANQILGLSACRPAMPDNAVLAVEFSEEYQENQKTGYPGECVETGF